MTALFLLSLALLGYLYLGFPALLWLRARNKDAWQQPTGVATTELPSVSIIVCAYNEADSIDAKIDSLLAQRYPAELLDVIIASDGSDDATESIVAARAATEPRIELLRLPRQGKVPTLNAAVAAATGSILVFTDANSLLDTDAVAELVGPFADPAIGGVAGDQQLTQDAGAPAAHGERSYWDIDRQLKRWQSRGGSVVSATGALYALRRTLFQPLPAGVTDDFAASTLAVLAGYRLLFVESAIAREPPVADSGDRARKARIMTRGFNAVWQRRPLLNPGRFGFYAHQLLVLKVLRRLAFIPLFLALVSAIALAPSQPIFLLAAIGQIAAWAMALCGAQLGAEAPRLLKLAGYFWVVNSAAVQALWNFLRGHRIETWNPRGGEVSGA